MTIRGIREDLGTAFEVAGLTVYDTLPELGELPLAAVSWPDRVRYTTNLAGGMDIDLVVTVAVSVGDDFSVAQQRLDELMEPDGFPQMVDDAVSEWWSDAHVVEAGNVRQVSVGAQALAVDFVIEVTV
jgi:hypothetical protein